MQTSPHHDYLALYLLEVYVFEHKFFLPLCAPCPQVPLSVLPLWGSFLASLSTHTYVCIPLIEKAGRHLWCIPFRQSIFAPVCPCSTLFIYPSRLWSCCTAGLLVPSYICTWGEGWSLSHSPASVAHNKAWQEQTSFHERERNENILVSPNPKSLTVSKTKRFREVICVGSSHCQLQCGSTTLLTVLGHLTLYKNRDSFS